MDFPDPATAALVESGEWVPPTADRLPAVADAVIAAWTGLPWPPGLRSYSLFRAADAGVGVIRDHAQWMDERAADDFARAGRRLVLDRIAEAQPGTVHRDHQRYRLYRGTRPAAGTAAPRPGAMVAVRVDTDDAVTARSWIDAVFEALARDRHLPTGGLGAFFHVSADGRHVLNYAEWVSAQAHRDALAATGRGIARGPWWDKVQHTPGVRPHSVTRFHLHHTLTA